MTGYFLGLCTIDLQYLINTFPTENTKQKSENFCINVGGPSLNAAAAFVSLGGVAKFFTVIGQNPLSPYIYEECHRLGLTVVDMAPEFNELPIVASVLSNQQNGARTIIRNKGIPPTVDVNLVRTHLEKDPDIILLDGFHMDGAVALATYGKKEKIPIVMDGGSWKDRSPELIQLSDIAIVSNDFRVPESSVMEYLKKQGIKLRAITKGSDPIAYEMQEAKGNIEVPQVEAIDSLGAGDIFHGAFCYYYLQNKDFPEALRLASRIAADSTTHFGTRD